MTSLYEYFYMVYASRIEYLKTEGSAFPTPMERILQFKPTNHEGQIMYWNLGTVMRVDTLFLNILVLLW